MKADILQGPYGNPMIIATVNTDDIVDVWLGETATGQTLQVRVNGVSILLVMGIKQQVGVSHG